MFHPTPVFSNIVHLRRPFSAVFALFALGAALALPAAAKPANSECFDCHDSIASGPAPLAKKGDAPAFPAGLFAKSMHAKLACVDCHADISDVPHDKLQPAQCASCHGPEAKQYATSIHGVSHQMGASGAATCTDCHGSHAILGARTLESPVFKLNLPRTCAKCHNNPGLSAEYRIPLYRGGAAVYGIDLFASAGVYGIAELRSFTQPPSGYRGFARVPLDLDFNLGLRVDTAAGGIRLGVSTLVGFIPFRTEGQ